MKTSLVSAAVIATFAVGASFQGAPRQAPERVAAPAVDAQGMEMLGRLPVAFVPNLGQWEHAARYVARVGAMTVFLEREGWSFTLVERAATRQRKGDGVDRADEKPARGVAVRMAFAHAMQPELIAEQRLPGAHNYFLGNEPSKWRSDVPLFGAVRYRGVYPGVDVRTREHDGHFEYDLLLQPDADLEPVEIVVEGIDRMHLDEQGALVMETRLGPVRMPVPLSWDEAASGEKHLVACRYELRGADRFGFAVTGRRTGCALVVDPGLLWSTLLGGASDDYATAIALDAQGAAAVAGYLLSPLFPTTPGTFDTSVNGGYDVFVTQLSPTGSTLVYSTFLGGSGFDQAWAIALDAQGAASIAGATTSPNFPTTPGTFDTSHNGGYDAFVTRLTPSGATLAYSTYLGGASIEVAYAVALDAQGSATVAGYTGSNSFPATPGAFDTTHNGGYDAFVARFSPTGATLVYSTFLGGSGFEQAWAMRLDAQDAVTVAGATSSSNFPTTPGSFDTSHNGGYDAFVGQLSPAGSTLVWSTFLGGAANDRAAAVAIDAQGAATVAGYTDSTDFPTTPGIFGQSYHGGISDAFVTSLSATGATLVYSTFLGGATFDYAEAIDLDAQGAATVAGQTNSANFPTTQGAFDTSHGGSYDGFLSGLSPSGMSLVYSTFLGGSSEDAATAFAFDAQGAATIAGYTLGAAFPTTPGAFDTTQNGGRDAFVARLRMLPAGVVAFGSSSPGCSGPLPISVNSMPAVGNLAFALTCSKAAPSSIGVLGFSGGGLPAAIPVLGVDVWIDPTALWTAVAFSNALGASEVAFPIPPTPALAGLRLFAQFVWFGPAAPPPCPPLGFSATSALDITIQP